MNEPKIHPEDVSFDLLYAIDNVNTALKRLNEGRTEDAKDALKDAQKQLNEIARFYKI